MKWVDLKKSNIIHWVEFCCKMFELLSDRVDWWCTINEPAVYATMGYVLGEFPPGVRSFKRTRMVSLNLMRAHAQCYRKLKEMKNGQRCQIGLVKNINLFDPYRRWNPCTGCKPKSSMDCSTPAGSKDCQQVDSNLLLHSSPSVFPVSKAAAISSESITTPTCLQHHSCPQK